MGTTTEQQVKGRYYEDLALEQLEKNGYTLVERNFHSRLGEIDLIMKKHKLYVFVEVRYRQHQNWGSAQESVTKKKQNKIIRTASLFLQKNKLQNHQCRFDVITFNGSAESAAKSSFEWIENAILGM